MKHIKQTHRQEVAWRQLGVGGRMKEMHFKDVRKELKTDTVPLNC